MSDGIGKKTRVLIWILVGSCILNLIFAINAGQKRKVAVYKSDTLDARLAEIELRYKNAVQSYDAIEKQLKDTKKDLEALQVYSDTLKETLEKEQNRSKAMQEQLDKLMPAQKALPAAQKKPSAKAPEKPKPKQPARSNLMW